LKDQLNQIIELLLDRGLRARLSDRKIELELTDKAKAFIADVAYEPSFGARPLRRYLQNHIETPLAKELITGTIGDGYKVVVDEQDGKLVFKESVNAELVEE
jgi:ATP-dependent Clp protease ATP-binding subunit ClpB